jgi:hypothetical protein
LAAPAVDAARRPLAHLVEADRVADDFRPDSERAGDQIDARSRLGHFDDLRQLASCFLGLAEANSHLDTAESSLAGHCPTVTM